MTEIKLTKRYPQSRTEDVVDAYMRGWNNALDAVQNGKFHIAEQTEPSISEIPNNCEPQTEQGKCPFDDPIPCEWVCTEWNHCKYKPKDEPKTDCAWKKGEVNE